MRKSRNLLFCLLLTCYPTCNADYSLSIVLKPRDLPETQPHYQWCSLAPDKMISMTLTPRDLLDNQNDNLKLCGLDDTVDNECLLSEWNSAYIFKFLDKTKESNAAYQTQVFEIPLPSTALKANTQDDKVVGLYSSFLAPPGTVCNSAALKSAAGGAAGFHAIFIGVSDDFSQPKRRFHSDQSCLEKAYDNQKPVLCGTKQIMGTERATSRMKTLLNIFNFPYNTDRQLKPNTIKQCKTVEATIETIKKSTYFDTKPIVSFRESKHQVSETDGFVQANIQRSEKSRKGLAHLETSFPKTTNAANEKDITPYDGPVIFEKNSDIAEVFIGLKLDEEVEQDEIFTIKIEPFEPLTKLKRRKRTTTANEPAKPIKITETDVVIANSKVVAKPKPCKPPGLGHKQCKDPLFPWCAKKGKKGECAECLSTDRPLNYDEPCNIAESPVCVHNKCGSCKEHNHCSHIHAKTYCFKNLGPCVVCDPDTNHGCTEEDLPRCLQKVDETGQAGTNIDVKCVACMEEKDCKKAALSFCKDNECVKCTDDSNCKHIKDSKGKKKSLAACNAGECVECTGDAHCTEQGHKCVLATNKCEFFCTTPKQCFDLDKEGIPEQFHNCDNGVCGFKAKLECSSFWYAAKNGKGKPGPMFAIVVHDPTGKQHMNTKKLNPAKEVLEPVLGPHSESHFHLDDKNQVVSENVPYIKGSTIQPRRYLMAKATALCMGTFKTLLQTRASFAPEKHNLGVVAFTKEYFHFLKKPTY